jgi:hypothetical protein
MQITALDEETGAQAFFALAKPGQDLPEVHTSDTSKSYWQGQEQGLAGFASRCFPNAGEIKTSWLSYRVLIHTIRCSYFFFRTIGQSH